MARPKLKTIKATKNNQLPANPQLIIQDIFIREARVNYIHCEHVMFKISGPADVANFVRSILTDNSREHSVALFLDGQHQVAAYSIVSIGSANSAIATPREIFQRAIVAGAISIVISHNHPSGSTQPSDEDHNVTKRLHESGTLLGIKMLDHVIVTDTEYYSFSDSGIL